MSRIFISYRREDSQGEALHLFGDLKRFFGTGHVFMDVTGIDPGKDFRKVIEDAVGTCDVLIAMIGKKWLDVVNEAGKRRLDDPKDFVRLETAAALHRNVAVIPILIQGVGMPRSDQLPAELEALAWRNAFELRHNRWDSDVAELLKALKKILPADVTLAAAPSTNFQNSETGKHSGVQESYRRLSLTRNLTALFAVILGGFMLTLVLYGNPLKLFAKPYISTLEFVDYHASGGSNDLWSGFLSLDDCSKKCLEDQNCKGFTYSNSQKKCFLKDSLGKQIQNKDTYSGIKRYR